ncbi:MAG: hypothetical protein JXK07_12140 [Spirochaetes bacterium]|nr:hypothetical protein [Spirochaetota bacterium]MBN2770408.1 hypothetical protein [Spirochaetota bacterium]
MILFNKSKLPVLLVSFSLFLCINCENASNAPEYNPVLFYSLDRPTIKEEIINRINSCKESLIFVSNSINDTQIAQAVVDANLRGIDVTVVIDGKNNESEQFELLINNFVPAHTRAEETKLASFFMIFDNQYLMLGNYEMIMNNDESLSMVFVVNNKDLIKHFHFEFSILSRGASSADKDFEFDQFLGPMTNNDLFDPEWYLSNQILLETGTNKGTWNQLTTEIENMNVTPFFTPYNLTELRYGTFELNELKTWSYNTTEHIFTDYETDETIIENHNDFYNILIPELKNSKLSLTIVSNQLNDMQLIHEIVQLANKGVDINLYLDYQLMSEFFENFPETAVILDSSVSSINLFKTKSGASLDTNIIIIDDNDIILSNDSFTGNSFNNNDNCILIINDANKMISEIERIFYIKNYMFINYSSGETNSDD